MSDNNEILNQQDLENPVLDEAVAPVEEAPGAKKPVKKDKPSKEKRVTGKETFSKARAIIGVLLIVAAIVTGILLVPVLSGQETTYDILYAKVDVPAGVQITDENIGTYFGSYTTNDPSLYGASIPAAQAADVLRNAYTARDIYAGKYPSRADFSATNLLYNDVVPAGYELVAINIPSMQGNVGYMPKAGDIIKFYGVGNRYFHYSYPDPEKSKFGLERINGKAQHHPFDLERLKETIFKAAETLEIDIYGGDCIVNAQGEFFIIDFNDFPSFSAVRNEAAKEISAHIMESIDTNI
jgi:hypothetical protein